MIPIPCPPTQPLKKNEPPSNLPIPPITWNDNTVTMISLAQMGQCNGCENARNDIIFNSYLGSGAGPWVSIPCLLQDTSHIHWLHPPKQSSKCKIFKRFFPPATFIKNRLKSVAKIIVMTNFTFFWFISFIKINSFRIFNSVKVYHCL